MNQAQTVSIPGRMETIQEFKQQGGKIAAVFPIHYPRGLLRAFGYLPVEIWGPPAVDTGLGDAHLQAYTCGIVRCGLSFLLAGKLDPVDLILVPHACDSLQGLGSILLDFIKPDKPVLTVYVARGDGNPADAFLQAELRSLYKRLAGLAGKEPSDGEILAAIRREEEADQRLASLMAARSRLPLPEKTFYRVIRSREYLPAERFILLADNVLGETRDDVTKRIPIVLSGIVPEPMDVLDAIENAGGMVVADDCCCTGRRLYPAGTSEEPFERMTQNLRGGPPDSTRGSPIEDRIRHLVKLTRDSGARGVLFYNLKFCEPEQFYLPSIRKGLESSGIRSVEAEGDLGERLPDQIVTRIEAFLETLS
jgi:benzoyl-CoA reductase/2-hydroxyglutaryl-CoA dehydratase subunit BcrC/BadD/HgdB